MRIMEIINMEQGIHASTACSAGGLPEKADRWTEIALAAQRKTIFIWLLENYAGGGVKIGTWNDHHFSISSFRSCDAPGISSGTARRAFDRLASRGQVVRWKYYEGSMVNYRFPRSTCDEFAHEAIEHYRSIGYSQDEIRPKVVQ